MLDAQMSKTVSTTSSPASADGGVSFVPTLRHAPASVTLHSQQQQQQSSFHMRQPSAPVAMVGGGGGGEWGSARTQQHTGEENYLFN